MKSKNGKQTKKISILAILVALICMTLAVSVMANEPNRETGTSCYTKGDLNGDGEVTKSDALYLLYHTVDPEAYPLPEEQDGNFDEDAENISGSDALTLLLAIVNPEYVPEEVHCFGEPIWTWVEENGTVVARAKYTCACGEDQFDGNVTQDVKESVNSSCTENGSITYSAIADLGFTSEHTVVVQAKGHDLDMSLPVCMDKVCRNGCGYTEKGAAHVLNAIPEEVAVEGEACTYEEVFTCANCHNDIKGKKYVKHTYIASITTQATCVSDGVKEYKCSKCNHVDEDLTETIAKDTSLHIWDNGTADDTGKKITHKCTVTGCTEEKVTIAATTETETSASATVDKDTLAQVGEVELKDAAIKLDTATLGQLAADKDVAISVEKVDKTEIPNLDSKLAGQIGENKVYNFSMTSGTDTVSEFAGEITITLPYTLQPGDDVDCIDIWFINDKGEVEVKMGTYNNGYVTFTTDHFSYYTVTKLTPAQRCEAYKQHIYTSVVAAPTCEADGYTLNVCSRCGHTEKSDIVPMLGHNYVQKEYKAVTCTEAGYKKTQCENCNDVKEEVTFPEGHKYSALVEVEATCESRGYTSRTCSSCGNEEITYTSAVAGHDYEAVWTWDKEKLTATLVLTCKRETCESTPVKKDATIGIEKQVGATCAEEGYIIYTAQIKHNGLTYNDTYTLVEAKLGHKLTNEWKYNALNHYKVCATCGEKVNESNHKLGEAAVITEPTCTTTGVKTAACDCGYVETTELPALGHNLVDEDCTRCDFTTNTCNHEMEHVQIDLSKYCSDEYSGETASFAYFTCECGRNTVLDTYNIYCDFEWTNTYTTDKNGFVVTNSVGVCNTCGLKIDQTESWIVDNKCSGTSYRHYIITDKNGTILVDFEGVYMENVEHPQVKHGATDDLTKYGLCAGKAVQTSCSCGKYKTTMMDMPKCNFIWLEDESTEDTSVVYCSECGIKLVSNWARNPIDKCHFEINGTESLYKGDTKLVTYEFASCETSHEGESKSTLVGDKCTDGCNIEFKCKNCDYEEAYFTKPRSCEFAAIYKTYDLSKYDLCVDEMDGAACACGGYSVIWNNGMYEAHNEEEVDFKYTETDNLETYWTKYECSDCDLVWEITEVYKYVEDSCEVKYSVKSEYKVKDVIIAKELYSRTEMWHDDEVLSYTLMGDSCEDGIHFVEACKDCGRVYEYDYRDEWHPNLFVREYNLTDYGFCGGIVHVESCACGEEQHVYEYSEPGQNACLWDYWKYDEKTNSNTYKCRNCGMYKQDSENGTLIEGCLYRYTIQVDYMSDYEVLFTAKVSRERYNHDLSYEYNLRDGATCKGGVDVTETCKDCGHTSTWYTEPWEEDEHCYFQTEEYELADYGFCGGWITHQECPCGEIDEWYSNIYGYCDWQHLDGNCDGASWRQCTRCHNIISEYYEQLSKENCNVTRRDIITLYDANETEILCLDYITKYKNHNMVARFELDNGATSCNDGYMVYQTCEDCGFESSYHEFAQDEHHYTYVVDRVDLSDTGLCGGVVEYRECACGKESYVSKETVKCRFEWHSNDEETDSSIYKCGACGATEIDLNGETIKNGCERSRLVTENYYNKDGELIFQSIFTNTWTEHEWEIFDYVMNGTSCENGVLVHQKCTACGVISEGMTSDHDQIFTKKYDLAPYNVCPGMEIEYRTCFCDQNACLDVRYWDSQCEFEVEYSTYVDDTGVKHEVRTESCRKCGLTIREDRVNGNTVNCMRDVVITTMISVKGNLVDVVNYTRREEAHDVIKTVELYDFSKHCHDGLFVTESCRNCDYSYTYDSHEHVMVEVPGVDSKIDLSQYGSNCGEYIVHKTCACGEYEGYYLEGNCNIGYSSITPWIGEHFEAQETSEGYIIPAYEAWNVKCAVTDPDCDLFMRKCDYSVYDEKTCTMQEYTVWQFGYNETTKTCQKEITIPGRTYAYHKYESSYERIEGENGDYKHVWTDVCACGSSVVLTHTNTADDRTLKSETVYTNTLLNGENRTKINRWCYVYYNDCSLVSEDYLEYVKADGSTEWWKTEYTYDFDNYDCTRIRNHTSYDGYQESGPEKYHLTMWSPIDEGERTCTQPADYYYICIICDEVDENSHYVEQPYGHDYLNNTCTRCGLYSENAADGSIVLEDMSTKYGNGTNYVIGFWNRDCIDFTNNVSIVTADGEVVTLTGINFTVLTRDVDGINAIAVNKAEVGAAMKATGVTGDVRIAFVPLGGTMFDYAITLTE